MNSNTNAPSAKDIIHQRRMEAKDAEIANLQGRIQSLTSQLESALIRSANHNSTPQKMNKRKHHPLSPHAINVKEIQSNGSRNSSMGIHRPRTIQASREKIGRTASIATRRVLDTIAAKAALQEGDTFAFQKMLDVFQQPSLHMDYLNHTQFAQDLLQLCHKVKHTLEQQPRVLYLSSPAYVFGDIHGNLEDLHFFSDNLWRLGMELAAGSFLFLGDYVDRGLQCLECVGYLLALQLQLPHKVFLLRGNHETRDVNGCKYLLQ